MKILIIRNYPSYMDVEKNTYNIQEVGLAKALVCKGHVCDIIFWTDREERNTTIPVDGKGNITIYYKHGMTALKNTVFTGCDSLFEQYDVLQAAEYNQMQSWLLAQKYPYKTIIYHGPYYSPFNKRYNIMCSVFDKIFLGRYLKLGTRFITKSKRAEIFLKRKGIKESNIATIGVGMDAQMLMNDAGECSEPLYISMKQDKNVRLLYIGRFEERRNIPFIFDIFSEFLKKSSNATLYMIGTGDVDYLKAAWKHADALGIRDHIVYQERMEQKYLSQIYDLADFFLLPTEYEIFGMVLLEAMYYRSVVLTTNNGGSSTLIENGENGYILDIQDSKAWANLLVDLASDKKMMIKISEKAHSTIESSYTWDSLADLFVERYDEVIHVH